MDDLVGKLEQGASMTRSLSAAAYGSERCLMRFCMGLIVSLVLSPACLAADPQPAPLAAMPEAVRDAGPCLVQVLGVYEGSRRAAGSGFLVSAEGHVLASTRAIERATELLVFSPSIAEWPVKAQELDNDIKTGLSLLKAEAPNPTPFVTIREFGRFSQGATAYVLGMSGGAAKPGQRPRSSEGAPRAAGAVKTIVLGYVSLPGRPHMVQFTAKLPSAFAGGPVLTPGGTVVGMAIPPPSESLSGSGWCMPIGEAQRLLAMNSVSYAVEHTAWSYVNWRTALSFVILALLLYGAYTLHVWQTRGKSAALRRLPAKNVTLCLLASGLVHLVIFVVVLLKQQDWSIEGKATELAEVGIMSVGESSGEVGLPATVAPPPPSPTVASKPPSQRVPVQEVDAGKVLEEKAQEKTRVIGESAERADAEAAAAAGKAREGLAAEAAAGAAGRGKATEGFKGRVEDLLKKLDGAGGGSGGPGPGGDPGSRSARMARWRLEYPPGTDMFEFTDKHSGEIALWTQAEPDKLYYLSNLNSVPSLRSAAFEQEQRLPWIPVGLDTWREKKEDAFRRAGRGVGPRDNIVTFFPREFEEHLARIENEYRQRQGLTAKPKSTIFEVTPALEVVVVSSN